MRRINLIPQSRQEARHKRIRRRGWVAVCTAYAAVMLLACLTWRGLGPVSDTGAYAQELAFLDSELVQLQTDRNDLQPRLVQRRMLLSASRSIADQPDWSILLTYLANEILDDRVVLTGCSLAPTSKSAQAQELRDTPLSLTLHGYAKTTSDVSRFVLRLEQVELFDGVSLTRTNLEPFMAGQAIAFEAVCRMGSLEGETHE